MSFAKMMTDTVELLKKDGTRVPGLKASVQKNQIVTFENSVLIEPQDLLIRRASNGAEETYEVIDPGFHEKFGSIPASYQIEVRKLGLPEAQKHVQSIVYNVSGAGARVNHHSVDNSINTITLDSQIQGSLNTIREELRRSELPQQEMEQALEIVGEVQQQLESGSPRKTIVSALLGALPSIAAITKAAGVIVSAL
ncbi:TPA: hypothetical protein QEM39_003973 [Pseudomonas putida]|uniref:hypothetical protein n=1 Tax=Pseudomonas putida TaxID=303 RepID=UPI0023635FE3|nr:hypothetical protein [Pseudomonas putida]MDD2150097.1 hypothetical protein [Pseudomonas putida]HDS1682388.1 hypothetical protein [Pseudomonas putida]